MESVSPTQGQVFFEKTQQVLQQPGWTEKERIPKYRTVLGKLFWLLSHDEIRYFHNLYFGT
jgi:hypothetical protein